MRIIKIGGSSVTYKHQDIGPPYFGNEMARTYRIREDVIASIGRTLKKHLAQGLILVHGGGTHGHRTVARWRSGIVKGPPQRMAWEVRWRMDQLSDGISRVLGRSGVPVTPIRPSDIMVSNGGSIKEFDLRAVKDCLSRGCVPMLRGDLVPDVSGGWSVVSGDTMMFEICKGSVKGDLPPVDNVIMCMEKEGFMKDYGTADQELIKVVDPDLFHERLGDWSSAMMSHGSAGDVSGGVLSKVRWCHRMSSLGIEVRMIGSDLGRSLDAALQGADAGTLFPPRQGPEDCIEGRCAERRT